MLMPDFSKPQYDSQVLSLLIMTLLKAVMRTDLLCFEVYFWLQAFAKFGRCFDMLPLFGESHIPAWAHV